MLCDRYPVSLIAVATLAFSLTPAGPRRRWFVRFVTIVNILPSWLQRRRRSTA